MDAAANPLTVAVASTMMRKQNPTVDGLTGRTFEKISATAPTLQKPPASPRRKRFRGGIRLRPGYEGRDPFGMISSTAPVFENDCGRNVPLLFQMPAKER